MTELTNLTFEEAYGRLQAISTRVTSEEVPVAEMCDLFAEGKGLQSACVTYLDEQKSRVEAIERGEGIQRFRIVAPAKDDPGETQSSPSAASASEWSDDDFEVAPAVPTANPAPDNDIPF